MARPADRSDSSGNRFAILAAACVVVAALYFASAVLIPLALAILLTFLLAPLATRVERWRVPRVVAVLLIVLLAFAVIGALGYVIEGQIRDLATKVEGYQGDIIQKMRAVQAKLGRGVVGKAQQTLEKIDKGMAASQPTSAPLQPSAIPNGAPDNPVSVAVVSTVANAGRSSPSSVIETALGFIDPLFKAFVVIVFVIFMLIQREDLRDRLIRLLGHGNLTITTQALDEAGHRVSKYLLTQSIINASYAVVIGVGLWLLGIPNAVLWGLICGLLRFVPYVGPWIGALFPVLLSFALPGSTVGRTLATLALFVVVELITSNAIEPVLYGSSTGVSSVAILVAAVFWTWLWGAAGLLLSTPLTVCLAVLGKYVPQMSFLAVLLGDEPVLARHERYYQRLLADDPEEATELVQEFLKDTTLEEVYDTVLIPTLLLAERDHARGALDGARHASIIEAMRDQVDELREQTATSTAAESKKADEAARAAATAATGTAATPAGAGAAAAAAADASSAAPVKAADRIGEVGPGGKVRPPIPASCTVNVLCLPANHGADDIAGRMFAHLVELQGYCAYTVTPDALASEMVEAVEKVGAHFVCVSALPPGAVTHSRYLCKRLHGKFQDVRLLVGLWHTKMNLEAAVRRIACDRQVEVASNFAKALDELHELVQPLIIQAETTESPEAATREQAQVDRSFTDKIAPPGKPPANPNRTLDPDALTGKPKAKAGKNGD